MSRKKRRSASQPSIREPAAPAEELPLEAWLTGHERPVLLGVAGLSLLLSSLFLLRVPFAHGPDEQPHFLNIRTLVETRRLPYFTPDLNDPNFEAHQPPLYYLLSIPFYIAAGGREPTAGRAVAVFSLGLGLLLLGVTFRSVKELFPDRPLISLGATAFVGGLPMMQFLYSRVNNDNLVNVLWGLAVWLFILTLKQGLTVRRSLGIGVVVGAALLTKSVSLLLLPLAMLTVFLRARHEPRWFPLFLRHSALAGGVALLLAGWWFGRNRLLYGDFLAAERFHERFIHDRATPEQMMALYQLRPHALPLAYGPLIDFPALRYWAHVFTWIFASFWGVLGHMQGFLPGWIYGGLAVFSLAACLGSLRLYARLRRGAVDFQPYQQEALGVLGTGMFLLLCFLLHFNTVWFQAQARYLFPLLPGFSLFFLLGLNASLPRRFQPAALGGLLAWLLLASILSLSLFGPPYWDQLIQRQRQRHPELTASQAVRKSEAVWKDRSARERALFALSGGHSVVGGKKVPSGSRRP